MHFNTKYLERNIITYEPEYIRLNHIFFHVDTQDPTFTGCDEIKRVPKFRTLADIPISPSDNTGIDTITADEDIRLPVTEDINVTYTATDFQGNSADCMYIVVMTGMNVIYFTSICPCQFFVCNLMT